MTKHVKWNEETTLFFDDMIDHQLSIQIYSV